VKSSRLDEALVTRGFFASRSRARDAVLRGTVQVNGEAARKPSQSVSDQDDLRVDDAAQRYVSRAALKLLHGIDQFQVDVRGKVALDIGASTGGFTQVLLERGAARVIAVDVGHGQMAEALRADRRVTLLEGLNARDLSREHVPDDVLLIVCDVSFISLKLALPPAMALVSSGAQLIALIKPQFEVGRENVGKGGVVTDETQHRRVCDEIVAFLQDAGWRVVGVAPSPVEGGDGNREFLVGAENAA
jgi:23S rRNA (cytidine1920-2'-O)/16S rRNA (cytidine1409-2'-O)-methyltransferase